MTKAIKVESKKGFVSPWLKYGSYAYVGLGAIIIIFSLLFALFSGDVGKEVTSTGDLIGIIVVYVFIVFIACILPLICSAKCSRWAVEIKKSPNIAYVIGFFLSVLGLFGYWIYYKSKQTAKPRKETEITRKESNKTPYCSGCGKKLHFWNRAIGKYKGLCSACAMRQNTAEFKENWKKAGKEPAEDKEQFREKVRGVEIKREKIKEKLKKEGFKTSGAKDESRCSRCGKKFGFFSRKIKTEIGTICSDCETKLFPEREEANTEQKQDRVKRGVKQGKAGLEEELRYDRMLGSHWMYDEKEAERLSKKYNVPVADVIKMIKKYHYYVGK